jgi:NAD(P)-dependent dehydrogenase (short-subunit alcohol dehydrogenase family)
MGRMSDRIALVTGASSGIGRATARLLADEGAVVALVALPGAELESAVEECRARGAAAIGIPADVADPAAVSAPFDRAAALGTVDAVFNNAGISIVAPVTETTDEQWQRLLATNLSGAFYVAREAARRLIAGGRGAIVNTASELALTGQAGYVAYTATKGGILALTRSLAAELAQHGVRVNAVCPGAVDTPLLQAEFQVAGDPEAERAENERSIVLGRLGRPEEIARAVVFLLSDEASYVTGAQWSVDGGRTGCFPVGTLARHGDAERAG